MFNFKKYFRLSFFILPYVLLMIFAGATCFYYLSTPGLAQENDAIAIYIKTNPNKYSALRWYQIDSVDRGKEYNSAPEQLMVDGYEAIRDGRTVYVNAGNLSSGGTHFSNIYMLSYTQEGHPSTRLVFNDMLKRWTFNTNMTADDDYGTCSISALVCLGDEQCPAGYECRVDSFGAGADNKCHLPPVEEEAMTCWKDSDCVDGVFCSGAKAALTRQTRRYAKLMDLKELLQKYFNENGEYPDFTAGSYVQGITLSTWDSWKTTEESLASYLDSGVMPVDPINVMGACPGNYDPKTCWDEINKSYASSFDAEGVALGPQGSSFLGYAEDKVYSFSPDGILICDLGESACYTR